MSRPGSQMLHFHRQVLLGEGLERLFVGLTNVMDREGGSAAGEFAKRTL